jgi:hypothetical protein
MPAAGCDALQSDRSVRNLYKLHSVLVHSGEAQGGHYYAFIRPDGNTWQVSAVEPWWLGFCRLACCGRGDSKPSLQASDHFWPCLVPCCCSLTICSQSALHVMS